MDAASSSASLTASSIGESAVFADHEGDAGCDEELNWFVGATVTLAFSCSSLEDVEAPEGTLPTPGSSENSEDPGAAFASPSPSASAAATAATNRLALLPIACSAASIRSGLPTRAGKSRVRARCVSYAADAAEPMPAPRVASTGASVTCAAPRPASSPTTTSTPARLHFFLVSSWKSRAFFTPASEHWSANLVKTPTAAATSVNANALCGNVVSFFSFSTTRTPCFVSSGEPHGLMRVPNGRLASSRWISNREEGFFFTDAEETPTGSAIVFFVRRAFSRASWVSAAARFFSSPSLALTNSLACFALRALFFSSSALSRSAVRSGVMDSRRFVEPSPSRRLCFFSPSPLFIGAAKPSRSAFPPARPFAFAASFSRASASTACLCSSRVACLASAKSSRRAFSFFCRSATDPALVSFASFFFEGRSRVLFAPVSCSVALLASAFFSGKAFVGSRFKTGVVFFAAFVSPNLVPTSVLFVSCFISTNAFATAMPAAAFALAPRTPDAATALTSPASFLVESKVPRSASFLSALRCRRALFKVEVDEMSAVFSCAKVCFCFFSFRRAATDTAPIVFATTPPTTCAADCVVFLASASTLVAVRGNSSVTILAVTPVICSRSFAVSSTFSPLFFSTKLVVSLAKRTTRSFTSNNDSVTDDDPYLLLCETRSLCGFRPDGNAPPRTAGP